MEKLFGFKNVTYHLGVSDKIVRASAAVGAGGVLAVQGPSGSGKSTLLRILARLQSCDDGEAWVDGTNWLSLPPVQWRMKVHYLSQKPTLFNGTVLENLSMPFVLTAVKKEKGFNLYAAQSGMKRLLLAEDMLYQDARTLSGGEAARVALLRALLFEPVVLLLDEPTAALDTGARNAVRDYIKMWLKEKPNRCVVLVSHAGDMEEFEPQEECCLY